jgi:hypothetical protein
LTPHSGRTYDCVMRRFATFAALLLALIPFTPGRAAAPSAGVVRPPSGGFGRGPALTWTGETYQAAANQSDFGDEPNCQDNPCDSFDIRVGVPSSYWRTRGGGLVVRIDGFDDNQDYDLWVWSWNQGRWIISGRTAGRADEVFIARPTDRVSVVVVPYQAVASTYRGSAYLTVHSLKPPAIKATQGLAARRVNAKDQSRYRPSVAMNPLNSNNLIATADGSADFYFSSVTPWIASSMDGGKTWRPSTSIPIDYSHDIWQIDPIATSFDDEGNAYIVTRVWWVDFKPFVSTAYAQSSIQVLRSFDGGRSWKVAGTAFSVLDEAARAAGVSQPWMAIDNSGANRDGTSGPISLCWTQWNGTPSASTNDLYQLLWDTPLGPYAYQRAPRTRTLEVMYAMSPDGGATWTPPMSVSGLNKLWVDAPVSLQPGRGSNPGQCRLATGPAGEVYVAWTDLVTRAVSVAAAPRAGAPFVPPVTVATASTARETLDGGLPVPLIPSIAVSGSGTVNVAWTDMRHGHADVFLSRSSDAARTWSAAARVTNDKQHGGNDQFMPTMSVTPSGQINILFYDRRNDRGNHFIDAYLARSSDGVRWRNTRISSAMSEPGSTNFGFFEFDFGWLGEFQGLVSDDRGAYALWTQRTGFAWQLWSARIPNTGGYR